MEKLIERIFEEEMGDDTSFQEKENGLAIMFGRTLYSKQEMRETWHRGIRHGIELGLTRASLEGQQIELHNNTTDDKSKEFLKKFYELALEYNCAIQYHPQLGMTVRQLKPNRR